MADNERAISAPLTSVVPRISSLTVNLSPGASLPLSVPLCITSAW